MTDTTAEPFACEVPDARATERAFRWSMVISGIRCTLTYVVFPFVTPLIGLAPGVGPGLGIAVGTVALVSNVVSFRRFQRSSHRWRVPAMWVHAGVTGLLVVMMLLDGAALMG
jgi:hypothetical protein